DLGLAVLVQVADGDLRAHAVERGLVAGVVAHLERAALAPGPHGVGLAPRGEEGRRGEGVVPAADAARVRRGVACEAGPEGTRDGEIVDARARRGGAVGHGDAWEGREDLQGAVEAD